MKHVTIVFYVSCLIKMFNKLKQFKNLRSQAKNMQKKMEAESLEVEKGGIKITINGANEILELEIADELLKDKEKLVNTIKSVFKDAVSKMQRQIAKKMLRKGKIDFDALKKIGFK